MKAIIFIILGIVVGFITTSLLFWEHGQDYPFLSWGINSDSSKEIQDCLKYLKSSTQLETSSHGHQRSIFCLKRPARIINTEHNL